jgi:hypothetical protein
MSPNTTEKYQNCTLGALISAEFPLSIPSWEEREREREREREIDRYI